MSLPAVPAARSHVEPGGILRVRSNSDPAAVGGAIAHVVRRDGGAVVSVIGAGALNQAVKGVALAGEFLAGEGQAIAVVPSFETTSIAGEERTAICLRVVPRSRSTEALTSLICDALRRHPEWRDRSDGVLAGALASAITAAE